MVDSKVIVHGISVRANVSCLLHAILQKQQVLDHNQQHKGFKHPGPGEDLHIRKDSVVTTPQTKRGSTSLQMLIDVYMLQIKNKR